MNMINQSRPFQQRLNDFGPELGAFLGKVWNQRNRINLRDFDDGMWQIYGLYSGVSQNRPYNQAELRDFINQLHTVCGNYEAITQAANLSLNTLFSKHSMVRMFGAELWDDFYHVLVSPAPAKAIRSRVYIHSANAGANIKLMSAIVQQFGKNPGLWEAKTAGPGSMRLDTIVCYLYDSSSADSLVESLKIVSNGLVTDSLPPLVRRVAPGIGTADEPPAIEIYRNQGTRHSFGSFFSTLCWVALKNTPNVTASNADGRHLLDNMLYSLRALQIDPKTPQRIPNADTLENWFRQSVK